MKNCKLGAFIQNLTKTLICKHFFEKCVMISNMKKLKDFEDDIHKCSKCGLCQSVCPVYLLTGNDCAVSRGKFVMLEGVLKGDLKLNKNIEKYLDMCMKCGKCERFCPSDINVCEILHTAKYECAKGSLHWILEKIIESDFIFRPIMKLCAYFTHLFDRPFKSSNNPKTRFMYFKGCVNNLFPDTERALKKIFSHLDVEISESDFDCCGLPFLSSGNLERYEKAKERNLKRMDCNYDYILTDCISCESTLKGYLKDKESVEDEPYPTTPLEPEQKYQNIKFMSAIEFLAAQKLKFKFKSPIRVTFHKPCHLENDDFLQKILDKCENVEYVEMKAYDDCCGFAGEFALKNRKISTRLGKLKAERIIRTEADIVITTCPACILGILHGYATAGVLSKNPPKVMNIIDFLALADIINTYK